MNRIRVVKEVNEDKGYFTITIYHLRTCLYFLLNYEGAGREYWSGGRIRLRWIDGL